jgi:hypothetical protein
VSGTIWMRQIGGDDSPTKVWVDLKGLADGPNPYHIHEAAVAEPGLTVVLTVVILSTSGTLSTVVQRGPTTQTGLDR